MGSTDLSFAMITGGNWFKVPPTIKVELLGTPAEHIYGKDIILELIRQIGVDGALYQAIEFTGDAIQHLNMADRFSISNMVIEAGAKNGIFEVDEVTLAYLEDRKKANNGLRDEPIIHKSDTDATYSQIITIDTSKLSPVIAYPFLPSNGKSVEQAVADDLKIDQVMIGSCTNGRIEDLRIASKIMKGKRVARHTRMIVTPATQKILLQAQREGLIEILIEAGAGVSNPTCGACLGGYMGILGDNERCVATTNRNFVGRMGARSSEIYLANSAVAAASAIAGKIVDPRA
jgi:3-isopropylmalate/(R)-2-methylmalate dehydratase large subunit